MLVFATAHDLHALEAFELGAADYLLKPFGEERVTRALRRLHQLRAGARGVTDGPPRIVARRRRSLVFLEPNEIWAFEAADRLTSVHTPHGTLDVSLSLAAVETSFGRPFVRVHRNWLVNAAHIRELERDSETKLFVGPGLASAGQGVWIPVARDRAAAVRDMLLANAAGVRQRS
jgi:DNA-binding LytR/AlgR family response regulator